MQVHRLEGVAMNRWEKLAAMPPAEEAMLHFESADDPLDDADLICDGCKEDWPCSFQRGMVATSNAEWWNGRLRLTLDALEHADGTEPDNSPLFWDGWHAAIAAVRVAEMQDGPGGLSTSSRQRISQRSRSRLPLSELSRTPQTARSDEELTTGRWSLMDDRAWQAVERAIWPQGPAHGTGSGAYAALKGRVIRELTEHRLDFIAQAQHFRAEHDATHGEAEMCGGECIVLGLADFEEEEHEHGPACLDCVALSRATVMAFAVEAGLATGPNDVGDVVRGVVARLIEDQR
jgi:hypothetical protein